MKAIEKIKTVLSIAGLFVIGILTGALLAHQSECNDEKDAENAKERKHEEIKNTPAFTLVSSSSCASELERKRDEIKGDFRRRIRDRFREELQRARGAGAS